MKIEDLKDSDIGRGVVYESYPGAKLEDGTVKSFNDKFVFVVYDHSGRGIATPPEKLTFLS
jgi:hypothetical protein